MAVPRFTATQGYPEHFGVWPVGATNHSAPTPARFVADYADCAAQALGIKDLSLSCG